MELDEIIEGLKDLVLDAKSKIHYDEPDCIFLHDKEVLEAAINCLQAAYPSGSAEQVDHPTHYQGRFECIDEMIALFGLDDVKAFCRCNAYKYRFRATRKGGDVDARKAEWYVTKLMELEEVTDYATD